MTSRLAVRCVATFVCPHGHRAVKYRQSSLDGLVQHGLSVLVPRPAQRHSEEPRLEQHAGFVRQGRTGPEVDLRDVRRRELQNLRLTGQKARYRDAEIRNAFWAGARQNSEPATWLNYANPGMAPICRSATPSVTMVPSALRVRQCTRAPRYESGRLSSTIPLSSVVLSFTMNLRGMRRWSQSIGRLGAAGRFHQTPGDPMNSALP